MILAGLVLVGIIVMAVIALGGKGKKDEGTADPQNQTAKAPPAKTAPKSRSRGRAGKKPDRPAPRLDAAQLAQARAYLKEGKALYNDAIRSWKSGAGAIDHEALQECKAVLEKGRSIFDEVTEWDEEATMEDWEAPGYVQDYLSLWQKLTKVFAKAHKISRSK